MRDPGQRTLIVIASLGLACSAIVGAGGWVDERVRLGADDREAFAQVEQVVREQFDRMIGSLAAAADAEVKAAEPVLRQPDENRDLRPLFDEASKLVARSPAGLLAVTVYSVDGVPLAWAGRPSELTGGPRGMLGPDGVPGPTSLFISPGPLGFRLVLVKPVLLAAGRPPARIGFVAVERLFSELATVGGASADTFSVETPLARVTLRVSARDVAPGPDVPFTFTVRGPSDESLVEASVSPADLRAARDRHRRGVRGLAVAVLALTALLLTGPVLDRRALARTAGTYLWATVAAAALVIVARLLLVAALPAGSRPVLSPEWPRLGPLALHAADFLLSSLAALALVALAAGPLERVRLVSRRSRATAAGGSLGLSSFAWLAGGGALLAFSVVGYERFLADVLRRAAVDVLHFSPQPWDGTRMAIALGLLGFHASFAWALVLLLRAFTARWWIGRRDLRSHVLLLAAWGLPVSLVWAVWWNGRLRELPRVEALLALTAIAAAAWLGPQGHGRLRHASQGYRLIAVFLALVVPALVMYPSIVYFHERARQRGIESIYGPEVLDQLSDLRMRLDAARTEIDQREAALRAAVSVSAPAAGVVGTDSAFQIWQGTALERHRVSSAIELYNAQEHLVSRFALNLPEQTRGQTWSEESCEWKTFAEISPFGSQERQLLHAGRNICGPGGVLGCIVIHVILDNSTLSFITSQNPYVELLRARGVAARTAAVAGSDRQASTAGPDRRETDWERGLEFVQYGWSRTALFVSGDVAWPIDDALFERISATRKPFWARIATARSHYQVFLQNDRSGIYALGYPVITRMGHFINLAELTVLTALAYVALLAGAALFRAVGARRVRSGRGLLREVRESFYRKLFLAFVVVSVVPVVTLALVTRAYIADRLRSDVEAAAQKTTLVARQIIEEYRVQGQGPLDDDAMVGLSRVIGQDVNIFGAARLLATSERDLFASRLLAVRTPAAVYRGIVLERKPTVITEEQVAGFRYIVAAAPLRSGERGSILTVPLTLRQQEIEREFDDLNRRIVLAAMLFILFGAAIGYPMAERIADPVNRLTRATRRIARGDFDARVAATSSDELRRLVEAFNKMAAELLRQRGELERTHRLEAWAEMARQVAHDIKNPLTPIQLSAEHLRRVHADRGRPLEPILEGCIDSILLQVRLLRQLASEFSSFASSPTARLAAVPVEGLVDEVVRPYETGGGDRWQFLRQFESGLPPARIDRTLIGRALTNVLDNALHAMPGGGTVTLQGRLTGDRIQLSITDTGVGMDEEALRRLFEPYFSTKAVGTGLGLSIARRNVELNNGTIAVGSERGKGTRVTITLPADTSPEAQGS